MKDLPDAPFGIFVMSIMVELTVMKRLYLSAILAISVLTISAQNGAPRMNDMRGNQHNHSSYTHDNKGRGHGGVEFRREKPASPEQVKAIVKLMKDVSFDDKKLNVAKVCLSLRDVPVEGIRKMVKTLSFSDNKMELLKYAYDYCYDREHYFTLCEELSFSSDKDELLRYLKKR